MSIKHLEVLQYGLSLLSFNVVSLKSIFKCSIVIFLHCLLVYLVLGTVGLFTLYNDGFQNNLCALISSLITFKTTTTSNMF